MSESISPVAAASPVLSYGGGLPTPAKEAPPAPLVQRPIPATWLQNLAYSLSIQPNILEQAMAAAQQVSQDEPDQFRPALAQQLGITQPALQQAMANTPGEPAWSYVNQRA